MIKTFAKVVGGVVVNVAVAEDVWPFANDPHIECPSTVVPGWTYNGTVFAGPVVALAPLAQRQDAAWTRIKTERDRRLLNGGFRVGTDWFYSDLISRSQNLANARKADLVKQAGGNMAAVLLVGVNPVPVKTMAGVTLAVTATLAHAMIDAFEAQELATYTAATNHQTAMMASLTPETYTFSTGWPAIFGG